MADFIAALKADLVEQFKGKANIDALMEVVGTELQQVYDFYVQLREERGAFTSVGKQLDGVGDIVVLSRMEAGILAGDPIPFDVIDDDMYRRYLIFKILKNTCNCTYPDIIKAFRMFWDRPLYYREDPSEPATMIFDTGLITADVDVSSLVRVPLLRAAGITLKLILQIKCRTTPVIYIGGVVGSNSTIGTQQKEDSFDFGDAIYLGGQFMSWQQITVAEDTRSPPVTSGLYAGGEVKSLQEFPIPEDNEARTATTILRTGGVTTLISHMSKGE